DICDALASCELRVGVHVQAITGGTSDAYSQPCPTPTPSPTPSPTPTGPTPTPTDPPTPSPTPTLPFCEIPTCEIFAVFSDNAQVNVQSNIGINPVLGPGGIDVFGNNLDLPCDITPTFPCPVEPCTESFIITCFKDNTSQSASLGVEVCVDPDLIQGADQFDCCNMCDPTIGGGDTGGAFESTGCSIAIGTEKIGAIVGLSGPVLILVIPLIVIALRRRVFGNRR
ncbi:MAG: hypothetical protein L0Y68_03470, partial [Candidatus Dadabacteria bacterium]|nr:hypothetical protein [Candidatus Dadabacteria bacterium]